MRILQLNAWTGRLKNGLTRFFEQNDFDIICLQEAVWPNRDGLKTVDHEDWVDPEKEPNNGDFERIKAQIEYFFATADQIQEAAGLEYAAKVSNWGMRILNGRMEQGNVILSRYPIENVRNILVHGEYDGDTEFKGRTDHGYYAQIVRINGINVVNYHGYWLPDPIGDEMTVKTMGKVADEIKKTEGPIAMCGDLNVVSASPAMRELDFLRDLTAENKLKTTLSGLKFDGEVACDHILVSDEVEVQDFKMRNELISDHFALEAEISVDGR